MADISPDMAILIRAAQAGGVTRDGNVIVPSHLEDWAREVLGKATPDEMKVLDDAIRSNFR
jgi:hypothetical protein